MIETQNLDPAALERLQRLGGDGFVVKMIELFLEFAGGKVVAARRAQSAGDLAGVANAVHPIKSSAGNVGACRMQILARKIEELARQGQAGPLDDLVAEMEQAFVAAKAELERRQPPPAGKTA
jgi:HPt (histidine-containing phosphotransfer) domain-containing protein